MNLAEYIEQLGGFASTSQLASFYGINAGIVRSWAASNGTPMVGNAYIFSVEVARAFAAEALGETEDEDGSEDEDDNEDEEADGEDDDGDGEDDDDEAVGDEDDDQDDEDDDQDDGSDEDEDDDAEEEEQEDEDD